MFKDKVKNLREAKGLSQRQLADELCISHSTLANYERGVRQPRTQDDWVKIANYFNVSVDYLMDNITESPPSSQYISLCDLSEKSTQFINDFIRLPRSKQNDIIDALSLLLKTDNDSAMH